MKNENRLSSVIKSLAAFIILVALTFFLIFREMDIRSLADVIGSVNLPLAAAALLLAAAFSFGEAMNIRYCLSLLGDRISVLRALKYAAVGFFFSSVTPSSTGGQPMQIYSMHRDGISPAHGTLALLTEFSGFQSAIVLYAAAGMIFCRETVFGAGAVGWLVAAGVAANALVLSAVLICIFGRRLPAALVHGVYKLLLRLRIKKADAVNEKLEAQLAEYRRGAQCLAARRGAFLRIMGISLLQIGALHSIPYFIYAAFSMSEQSYLSVLLLQGALYAAVSVVPLPGAVGASEGGFLALYKSLYPAQLLGGAMLLSRAVSFYIPVAVTGLFIACCFLASRKAGKRKKKCLDTV